MLFLALLLALQASLGLGFLPPPLFWPARLSPSSALLRSVVALPACVPTRRTPELQIGSEASQGQSAIGQTIVKSTARSRGHCWRPTSTSAAGGDSGRLRKPPARASFCCFVQVSSQYFARPRSIEGGGDGDEIGAQGYQAVTTVLSSLFAERGWQEVPAVGCSSSGTISGTSQTEGGRSVSITLVSLLGAKVQPFSLSGEERRRGLASPGLSFSLFLSLALSRSFSFSFSFSPPPSPFP